MVCVSKAKRAGTVLGDSKERRALDERIAACEAASLLSTRLRGMNGATLTQTLVVLQPYLADMPFQLGARVTGRLIQEEMQAVLFGNAKATPEEVPVRIKNMVAGFRFWDNDILTLADKPRVNPGKPSLQQAFAELLERQADGEEIAGDQEDAQFAELVQKQRALERRPSDPTREEDPADKSTFQPDLEATFVHV